MEDKEYFKTIMPLMNGLNDEEKDALIHKIENSKRSSIQEQILESETSDEFERKLAKISEEENYNMKNWYRH